MRILFVNNQHRLGGAETVVQQLREGVARAGHESAFFVAEGKTYPKGVTPLYPRWLSRLDHSRFRPLVSRFFPRFRWTDRRFRALSRERGDLVHLHNFHGHYATTPSLAWLAARKPVVWTFHAFWGMTGGCDHPKACRRYQESCGSCPQVGQWPVGPVDKTWLELQRKKEFLAPAPLRIIAPSRHLAEQVRGSQVGKNWRVEVIPNGVDPARFGFARKHDPVLRQRLGLSPEATVILSVNRDFQDAQKGHAMVEEALRARAWPGAQVLLAGQNSGWAAARLPPPLRPVDAGYVSSRERMAELFEAADVFLFASPAENFPCVILEAMSAQCCVVATPTSGVTEQVCDLETGFLARALDGGALARVLGEALARPELLPGYGAAARARVEREFSERLMVERHLDLYARVARGES